MSSITNRWALASLFALLASACQNADDDALVIDLAACAAEQGGCSAFGPTQTTSLMGDADALRIEPGGGVDARLALSARSRVARLAMSAWVNFEVDGRRGLRCSLMRGGGIAKSVTYAPYHPGFQRVEIDLEGTPVEPGDTLRFEVVAGAIEVRSLALRWAD